MRWSWIVHWLIRQKRNFTTWIFQWCTRIYWSYCRIHFSFIIVATITERLQGNHCGGRLLDDESSNVQKYGKNVSKIKIEHVNYVKYYYANTWNILFKHCLSVGSFLSVIISIFYCVCNRKAKRVDTVSNLNGFVIIYQRTMSSIQWFFWITEMRFPIKFR